MPGCYVQRKRSVAGKIQLPGDSGHLFAQALKVCGFKLADAHDNAVCQAQMKVCQVAVMQTAGELDAAFDYGCFVSGERKLLQLVIAELFKAGSSDNKKFLLAAGYISFDALFKSSEWCHSCREIRLLNGAPGSCLLKKPGVIYSTRRKSTPD
jgi:hypothetical protein